jgi:hypothetical protein
MFKTKDSYTFLTLIEIADTMIVCEALPKHDRLGYALQFGFLTIYSSHYCKLCYFLY